MQNVNIRQIELAPNLRVLLAGWNANTAEWLRHSVYNRIHPPNSKGSTFVATLVTFLISAFWHGYHPGYYLTFLGMAWLTYISRNCRKYIRPLFLSRFEKIRILYDIAGWICTHSLLAYNMPAFLLRRLDYSMKFYSTTYYHGHIILLISSLFFLVGGGELLEMMIPDDYVKKKDEIADADKSSEKKEQ